MDVWTPRQTDIVTLAEPKGRSASRIWRTRFNVTPQTIRKDLNDLCDGGVLQRFHGGAVLASGVANFGYEARRKLATDEKRRIGAQGGFADPRQFLAADQYRHHHRAGRRPRCAGAGADGHHQ